jgi:hypothetical protein
MKKENIEENIRGSSNELHYNNTVPWLYDIGDLITLHFLFHDLIMTDGSHFSTGE